MSYNIFYRTFSIKATNDQLFTFVEQGSNNVYEYNNRRRAREWYDFYFDIGALNWAKDVVSKTSKDETYNPKQFGYYDGLAIHPHHTFRTSESAFLNFFANSEKNAITFEKAFEIGVNFQFTVKEYGKNWKTHFDEYCKKTELDFFAMYEKAKELQNQFGGMANSIYLSVTPSISDHQYSQIVPKRQKTLSLVEKPKGQYVLWMSDHKKYVIGKTTRKIKMTAYTEIAKRFKTEAMTEKYIKGWREYGIGVEIKKLES